MELPIFRELESVWFRSQRPTGHPAAQPATEGSDRAGYASRTAPAGRTAEYTTLSQAPPASSFADLGAPEAAAPPTTTGTAGPTAMSAGTGDTMRGDTPQDRSAAPAPHSGPVVSGYEWRTAADDGWQAASSAADVVVQERTAAGLPKRRPMAQLVPGGVEKTSPTGGQRRSPEAVRGLLSAYHRGVQRGREQTTDGGASGAGASQSTQVGKERRT